MATQITGTSDHRLNNRKGRYPRPPARSQGPGMRDIVSAKFIWNEKRVYKSKEIKKNPFPGGKDICTGPHWK